VELLVKMAEMADSPTSGFAHRLSKTRSRHNKKSKDASSSQAAIERVDSNTTASSGHSLESPTEKLIRYATSDSGESNGLKRILSKSITPKRRQKREEERRIKEEVARGRSVAERGTLQNDDDDRFAKAADDDDSIYTDDYSDTEE
jgi:hypothetical protein